MPKGGRGSIQTKGYVENKKKKFCDLYVHGIHIHWNWEMAGVRDQITGDTRSIAPERSEGGRCNRGGGCHRSLVEIHTSVQKKRGGGPAPFHNKSPHIDGQICQISGKLWR